jgi:hypothetical protein
MLTRHLVTAICAAGMLGYVDFYMARIRLDIGFSSGITWD